MNSSAPQPARETRPSAFPSHATHASRRERVLHGQLRLVLKLLLIPVALLLAISLRSRMPDLHGSLTAQSIIACLLFSLCALCVSGIYHRAFPQHSEWHHLASSGLVTIALFSVLFFSVRRIGITISRPLAVFYGFFFYAGLIILYLAWEEVYRRGKASHPWQMVLVGNDQLMDQFTAKFAGLAHLRIVEKISERQYLPQIISRIEQVVREYPVDTVVLFPASLREGHETDVYQQVMQLCEVIGTPVQVHMSWFIDYRGVYLDHIGDEPVLTYTFAPALSWPLLIKRGLDIGLASLLLLLTSPLLLLTAIAIKLESPGPALFRQLRAGHRGRPFQILKFRTMVLDAEARKAELLPRNELSGPIFKMSRDPRITRIGRWLRVASIDELPQLWNVLRGQMSMVGPRPPTLDEVNIYSRAHRRRLSVLPGITGLWQVSGRTSISDFNDWVELDVEYIRKWSLWLDIKILCTTFFTVLRMTGR